jgi:hypothetical protein
MVPRVKFGPIILSTVALAGLGYANWHALAEPVDTSPVVVEATIANAAGDEHATLIEPKQLALADLAETLTRPLFYAGRRPISKINNSLAVAAAPVQISEPAKPDVFSPPIANLRLIGILSDDQSSQQVLIQSETGSPATWQRVGAEVDGWRVKEIAAEHVVVEASGKRAVLKLHAAALVAGSAQK